MFESALDQKVSWPLDLEDDDEVRRESAPDLQF
jgi:hypothetical protein